MRTVSTYALPRQNLLLATRRSDALSIVIWIENRIFGTFLAISISCDVLVCSTFFKFAFGVVVGIGELVVCAVVTRSIFYELLSTVACVGPASSSIALNSRELLAGHTLAVFLEHLSCIASYLDAVQLLGVGQRIRWAISAFAVRLFILPISALIYGFACAVFL